MATTIVTGRDLSLTINSVAYDAQTSTVTLTNDVNQQVYETLDGRVYKTIDKTAELQVEMYADWGAAGSICEALWTAADTAPDTALSFSFTAATGSVFAGSLYPVYPPIGGTAPDAQTVTVTFIVKDGEVNATFS